MESTEKEYNLSLQFTGQAIQRGVNDNLIEQSISKIVDLSCSTLNITTLNKLADR